MYVAHEIRFGNKCDFRRLHLHINKGVRQEAPRKSSGPVSRPLPADPAMGSRHACPAPPAPAPQGPRTLFYLSECQPVPPTLLGSRALPWLSGPPPGPPALQPAGCHGPRPAEPRSSWGSAAGFLASAPIPALEHRSAPGERGQLTFPEGQGALAGMGLPSTASS